MVTGTRLSYGVVGYKRVVAVVGLRLHQIGSLLRSEHRVYGPVVAWLVSRGCSGMFGEVRCGEIQIRAADATFRDNMTVDHQNILADI